MTIRLEQKAQAILSGVQCLPRSLSVVIPAYNEENRLPQTVQAIHRFLVAQQYDAEMFVINDGSVDRTGEAMASIQSALPLLRTINHLRNTGKGFAVKTGVLAATRKAILFCDADHSTPISDIDRLWGEYDRGCEIVVGSRGLQGSEILVHQPLHRQAIGKAFNGITRLLGLRGFRDTQCGFKLLRTDVAKKIFSRLRTNGFAFDVEMLLLARQLDLQVSEVPVHWANSPDSRVRPIRDYTGMLLELLRMRNIV